MKAAPAAPSELGVVVAAYGRRYCVELPAGEIECTTRGRKSDIACGDRVHVAPGGSGQGVIESVEPRRTLFYRSDERREKLFAANVTQIVVVLAPVPAFSEDLLNRCLIAAEHAEIAALIVLNKSDLPETEAASQTLQLYADLGYALLKMSAKTDVSPLAARLAGHTSVLVGQSGMGKSTIINRLLPNVAARVAEISAALGTGRHTTTHTELYHVDEQSHIIDSPGMQEFGLQHIAPEDAAHAFIEFRPFLGQCRFRDCRHMSEPDCALAAAATQGEVSARRLASYRRFAEELVRRPEWETKPSR